MATIAENLQTINNSTNAIKQTIIDNGGNISGGLTTYAGVIKDVINQASSSNDNTSTQKKDVNFYDYDGALLYSYSKDEFLSLSQLPELPTRDDLTCQGWNYNLSDAKTYVEAHGVLDIGATYITDDGKTRLYISIVTDGKMDVPIYFSQTVSNGVTIDWGDGSATQTISGTGNKNTTHTYNEIGDYVITLNPKSGCTLGLGHNSPSYCVMGSTDSAVYCNMLHHVEVGKYVTSINECAFYYCYSLSSIVIPENVTGIDENAFDNCYSLSSIVIPKSVTRIGNYAFYYCYSLSNIVIPKGVTSIGDHDTVFDSCYSLSSIIIPEGIYNTTEAMFANCYSLSNIVIPKSVSYISDYAFICCYPLSNIVIPENVTGIGDEAFYDCRSLSNIVMPKDVATIGRYAFGACYSLSGSIVMPRYLGHISVGAFVDCYSLSSIVMPKDIYYIGNEAFSNCTGMEFYDFSKATSIPLLDDTDAFKSIPDDCKIVVPDTLYEDWISETNWSDYADYIIKKSDWGVTETPGGSSGGSAPPPEYA